MSRTAAIFDLDGTLIPNTSAERTFFFYLLRNGGLSVINIVQMIAAVWSARGNWHAMTRGNKRYLRMKQVSMLQHVAHDYFEKRIDAIVFPRMREIVNEHRAAGDLLLLLTGTLDVIADCFVRRLHLDGAQSAALETRDGRYTGRVEGIVPYGLGKLEVLQNLRRRHGFDLSATTLYANIHSDRYVMNAVEHPVAVNPDRRLRAYAQWRGWHILDVTRRKGGRLT